MCGWTCPTLDCQGRCNTSRSKRKYYRTLRDEGRFAGRSVGR
ncbi:hypothetical protein GBAR_LOCUS13743 [Geodia barretti]|uniref:Uncharacterized protein n=1 Tax=Geodia barretti TaxID=519541 RepID=A0AA35S5Y0_GEOBA|nr:hypothetical protein GBAR_LOCUS13743 [Geodia barretti]